ncbi:MAG: 2-dehydro-3-deoxygalactonokinase [Bacteroidota bacterium]
MNHLLCCDWGTSNFRLYLVDRASGKTVSQLEAPQGIALTFNQWKASEEADRLIYFRRLLQEQIDRLGQQFGHTLASVPVVLSGMAASSIGMLELPYATLPFDLAHPNLDYCKIDATEAYPNDLYLFTGLRNEQDVMRGEEVQMLGIKSFLPENSICILPGTHSKHIQLQAHSIVNFKTYMTGEVFQLLKQNSILKHSVVEEELSISDFQKGVLAAKNGSLLHQLFQVRTNDILHQMPAFANYAFLSGLLIGEELKSLADVEEILVLASSDPLFSLYKIAIESLSIDNDFRTIEAKDLEQATPLAHLDLFNRLTSPFG